MDVPNIMLGCPLQNREGILPQYLEGILGILYPLEKIRLVFLVNNSHDKSEEILNEFKEEHGHLFRDVVINTCTHNYTDNRDKKRQYDFISKIWNKWVGYRLDDEEYLVTVDSDVILLEFDLLKTVEYDKPVIGAQVWNGEIEHRYYFSIFGNGGIVHMENGGQEKLYIHNPLPLSTFGKVYGVGGGVRIIKSYIFDKAKFQFHPQGEDLGLCSSIREHFGEVSYLDPGIKTYHALWNSGVEE